MTTRPHPDDAGLRAVARVRAVHEQDSRLGLQRALSEQAAREATLAELRERLAAVPALETSVLGTGSPAALLGLRTALGFLGEAERGQAAQTASGERITEVARGRWTVDQTRLAAVEMLLERRADTRRTEEERAAARAQDDVAAQRWLRGRLRSALDDTDFGGDAG